MSERQVRITLRDRQTTGGLIPSDALFGEPFINLYDGVLIFSAVTGGSYEPSSQSGVFEVGSTLYNQRISNRLSINNKFIVSGDTGIISTYQGSSSLAGKFLSGTSTGLILADIADIGTYVDSYTTGATWLPNTLTIQLNNGKPNVNVVIDTFNNLSANTIYSGATNLDSLFVKGVVAGSNTTIGGSSQYPIVNVVDSPSFNNINFSGIATGGAVNATSLSATNLTNTRVLFAGTNGQIIDDVGMTYNLATGVLTVNGNLTTNGTQYSGGSIVDDGIFKIDAATQVEIDSNVLPTTHLTYNLGAIGKRWNFVYARAFRAGVSSTVYGDGYITGDTGIFLLDVGNISVNGDINPSANTTYSLGTAPMRWNNVYTKDLDVSGAINTTGITISGLLAGSVVYAGSGGQLKTDSGFSYDENTDTFNTKYITVGTPGQTGTTAVIYGDILVVGDAISGFTSQLYIEDNNVWLNYNPTGDTSSASLGAGWSIQDGGGVIDDDVFFDIRGTATGVANRSFATNLQDIRIRESGSVSSPNGVRVIAEYDVIDGGGY
ncbi:MAG: hypothetical protein KatS3mg035_1106 [Bacteroidia bacterium]|nr:MAG: hypothetical protein KatS3mg035_1106 [Bacteroidia bacterium]